MTNITQKQIDNFLNVMAEIDTIECKLCRFTSHNGNNFHDRICLMCCRVHGIDY